MSTIWYRLPLIPLASFIPIMEPFYDIREGRHESKSEVDPIFACVFKETAEEKLQSQKRKALQMACGNIHEEVMGRLPGMRMFKNGHSTGCDVGTLDCSRVIELKNHINTMNGGGRKTVEATLLKQIGMGRKATLCIVNSPASRKVLPGGIEEVSGRDLYAELTGVPEFFDILIATIGYIFEHYATYTDLVAEVGEAAVETANALEHAKTPLEELSKDDLIKDCKKYGVSHKGTREELMKRIKESPKTP